MTFQVAFMVFSNDLMAQGQSQPGSFTHWFCREKWFKYSQMS